MDVERIQQFLFTERGVGANHDMYLQAVPKPKPGARIAKVRSCDLFQLEHFAIEPLRSFEVPRGNQHVMKGWRIHRQSLSYRSHSSRCWFTKASSFKCG